jgi:CBS domain-containing protein
MDPTMTGPVRLAMAAPVVSVDSATTLRRAARELDHEDIGAVVVLGPRGLDGVLSGRDIVRALARGADPDVIAVEGVMAEDPVSVDADTPIEAVADLTRDTGVRHLLVVAGDDVVGMISMRDVLDVVRREQTAHRDA